MPALPDILRAGDELRRYEMTYRPLEQWFLTQAKIRDHNVHLITCTTGIGELGRVSSLPWLLDLSK